MLCSNNICEICFVRTNCATESLIDEWRILLTAQCCAFTVYLSCAPAHSLLLLARVCTCNCIRIHSHSDSLSARCMHAVCKSRHRHDRYQSNEAFMRPNRRYYYYYFALEMALRLCERSRGASGQLAAGSRQSATASRACVRACMCAARLGKCELRVRAELRTLFGLHSSAFKHAQIKHGAIECNRVRTHIRRV